MAVFCFADQDLIPSGFLVLSVCTVGKNCSFVLSLLRNIVTFTPERGESPLSHWLFDHQRHQGALQMHEKRKTWHASTLPFLEQNLAPDHTLQQLTTIQTSLSPHVFLPPVISTILPLMYRLSSLNKKATTSATSSGVPILPSATLLIVDSTAAGPSTTEALLGVSMYPLQIEEKSVKCHTYPTIATLM